METSWKRDKYQRRGGLHRNSEDKVEEKAASGSPLHSLNNAPDQAGLLDSREQLSILPALEGLPRVAVQRSSEEQQWKAKLAFNPDAKNDTGLTEAQVRHFVDHGYVMLRRAFPPKLALEILPKVLSAAAP